MRDDIIRYLENHKIATWMLFRENLLKQPAYADMKYRTPGAFVNNDLVMNKLLWIGMYPGIDYQKLAYINTIMQEFMKTWV